MGRDKGHMFLGKICTCFSHSVVLLSWSPRVSTCQDAIWECPGLTAFSHLHVWQQVHSGAPQQKGVFFLPWTRSFWDGLEVPPGTRIPLYLISHKSCFATRMHQIFRSAKVGVTRRVLKWPASNFLMDVGEADKGNLSNQQLWPKSSGNILLWGPVDRMDIRSIGCMGCKKNIKHILRWIPCFGRGCNSANQVSTLTNPSVLDVFCGISQGSCWSLGATNIWQVNHQHLKTVHHHWLSCHLIITLLTIHDSTIILCL